LWSPARGSLHRCLWLEICQTRFNTNQRLSRARWDVAVAQVHILSATVHGLAVENVYHATACQGNVLLLHPEEGGVMLLVNIVSHTLQT
jgi:hypothetical protein